MPSGRHTDPEKVYQGKLCPRGHDDGTGHSVRRKANRACVACLVEQTRAWRSENPDKVREINRRPENRRLRETLKATEPYREKERARCRGAKARAAANAWKRRRYETNESFRVRCRLRARLRDALRVGQSTRASKYGIDWSAIVQHLGPQPGPDYEIDHVRPLCSFDLSDPQQVREAFAPNNHQWLPKIDNRLKGGRF